VQQVFVFPGNAGTQNIEAKDNTVAVSNITQEISNNHELAQHAKELGVGLVVVGPGDDVVNGIEECFREGEPVMEPR
jgi:phosphoribosylamine--glycine ligase/phosphoribosylformylglycinamidine cyclo-ligase